MIKPDGVQRELVGEIIARFVAKGLKLQGLKLIPQVSTETASAHYADLSARPFFGELIDYIRSGPVVAMCFVGVNAVKAGRQIIGATNPMDADAGSIRGTYATTVAANIIHGSDSVENAEKELALWFAAGEIVQ